MLQMWGGVECTINRVEDGFHTQLDRSGHLERDCDLARFAGLGLRTLRQPVLWEQIAPDGLEGADWSWPDRRMAALRQLGVAPIVGLVHHGSGPRHTSLLDPAFATGLAEYAGAVAARYPWVERWTPVNEPLTTARFSALYGIWYPHQRDDVGFVRVLLNECRATVLAMAAIRRVNPRAQLVQTDDLGRSDGTAEMASTVAFYNERRWLAWDLLCGRVGPAHPMYRYMICSGATASEIDWFVEHSCPPDVIGVNFYVTSDRWIDHRVERYPGRPQGGHAARPFVDIEAVRVLAMPALGLETLLAEAWQRYGIPIAVTEAHIDAGREDQLRWLHEIWRAAEQARAGGADVIAVTAWALLGAFDWNCLLGACHGYYEPGAFDVRSPWPRPTALAALVGELAAGQTPSHPVLQGDGWWRRAERFTSRPVTLPGGVTPLALYRRDVQPETMTPILIIGAGGTLGRAFATVCQRRHLALRVVEREDLDIADAAAVAVALDRWQPWAVVNAGGYADIDAAESDGEHCWRENTLGPTVLARECARRGIALLTFSSDQVFDNRAARPWVESDATAPLNEYGRSQAAAETAVLDAHPAAMVVRTSALFGPWDHDNFLARALDTVARGETFAAADNVRISPTYVPDLVNVCVDLLIDREAGRWHLASPGDVSGFEFASLAAVAAGLDTALLRRCRGSELGETAPRPRYGVLGSERASLMAPLEHALARFIDERRVRAEPEREIRTATSGAAPR
ncbi:MAG: family 1 glycosylhydrolase [Caldimonas sp.]